jgi:beta-mannanase
MSRLITVPILAALLVASLGASCVPATPPAAEQPSGTRPSSPPPPPEPFPPPGKVFLGINTNAGAYDFGALDAFIQATGTRPAAMQFTQGWANDRFDRGVFDRIVARQMLPILSWEPWDYQNRGESQDQPDYRLAAIIDGRYDEYIRSWANGITALRYPVVIRFAHEMNGFWYPWCEQSNHNQPGDYVKAWRHVHQIVQEAHATNVTWLWSPNVSYTNSTPLQRLYPGDEYVDWIGLSGYYGTAGVKNYVSFDRIFSRTFNELAAITDKPIVITETGATNANGERERWIREMFQQLPNHPNVVGVIWFEAVKEIDWRLASTSAAAKAFGENASQSRYQTPWTTHSIPNL